MESITLKNFLNIFQGIGCLERETVLGVVKRFKSSPLRAENFIPWCMVVKR
jgi:hypothetical protein